MVRLTKHLIVAALMISIGAQWVVLQSAAWVGMAVRYSMETGSVSKGLAETFDGEHPCALCDVVAKGQQSEKKNTKFESVKKLELFANQSCVLIIAPKPTSVHIFHTVTEVAVPRVITPPVPPPRSVAA
ncbi:MAG: hypothetical protein JWO89_1265 [Verrucomicrobiaceae bacterium]|nr:hypothetical protein [Verrucomicrobiaceae bacterium]MDB6119366.1 hypothetical protein [Verrucomicrobiaceae bacterium]